VSTVGQIEKKTQQRGVKLFRDTLRYDYLGDWTDREGNANIEGGLLRAWLKKQGVDDTLVTRAIYALDKAAGDTSKSLYDRNRVVYDLLRYGVKVKPDVGENMQTVWLIDWENPENNDFAIAEEVAIAAADPKAFGKRPDVVLYVNGIALGVLEPSAPPSRWPKASARISIIRKRSSSSTFSRPCSGSWRATTRRACATAPSRRRRSTT
jgi:type I restriction enzyme R subunit